MGYFRWYAWLASFRRIASGSSRPTSPLISFTPSSLATPSINAMLALTFLYKGECIDAESASIWSGSASIRPVQRHLGCFMLAGLPAKMRCNNGLRAKLVNGLRPDRQYSGAYRPPSDAQGAVDSPKPEPRPHSGC